MVSDFLLISLAILSILICLALGKHSHTNWMLIQGFCFIALTWTMQPLCSPVYLQPGPAYLRSPHFFAKRASTWIFSVANNLTCLTGFQGDVFISPCFMYFFSALFAFPLKSPPFFFSPPSTRTSVFHFSFLFQTICFICCLLCQGRRSTYKSVCPSSIPAITDRGRKKHCCWFGRDCTCLCLCGHAGLWFVSFLLSALRKGSAEKVWSKQNKTNFWK